MRKFDIDKSFIIWEYENAPEEIQFQSEINGKGEYIIFIPSTNESEEIFNILNMDRLSYLTKEEFEIFCGTVYIFYRR